MIRLKKLNTGGFTLIELLIATAVLSTILVMSTFIMMSIGRLYYKGINQAKIQNFTRSTASDITNRLQVNDKSEATVITNSNGGAICIGDYRYTYVLGKSLKSNIADGTNESKHVLWRDKHNAAAACMPTNPAFLDADVPSAEGVELMVPNGILTEVNLNSHSPFTLKLGAAYGDHDLLTAKIGNSAAVKCRGGTGGQFCATSYLETTVANRIVE